MNKFSFIGALAVLVSISPLGRAQIQNGDNAIGDFTIERILTPAVLQLPRRQIFRLRCWLPS